MIIRTIGRQYAVLEQRQQEDDSDLSRTRPYMVRTSHAPRAGLGHRQFEVISQSVHGVGLGKLPSMHMPLRPKSPLKGGGSLYVGCQDLYV